ncbi:MAG: hypothetical protein JWM73_2525 [Solirubrobacterales bacterium]|jgi:uncharacterized protein YxjI|nr:hypothetical protein [Solirubrobacterales bacterium]
MSTDLLPALRDQDRFLIQQVFKPIANQYQISIPAPGSSEPGDQVLYVKQKRMKIKEDIRFRVPGEENAHVFMIKAKSVFEFAGRYDVLDADDQKIGDLGKDFKKSLLRSHWIVRDAQENVVLQARESSMVLALLRRFAGALPGFLSLLSYVPFNFTLFLEDPDSDGSGTYQRVLGKLRDRYVVELGADVTGVDRRLLLAQAVALDALQDR